MAELITVENEELPIPFSNDNRGESDDPEIMKLQKVVDLINDLFTNADDRESEISDLTVEDISGISQLKYFDRILGFNLFGDMTKDFMRLSFSKERKSRGEIITAIRSLVQNSEYEENTLERKSRLKRFTDWVK